MRVNNKINEVNWVPENPESQSPPKQQQSSIWGNGFPDKDKDGYVNEVDFDYDKKIIKKLKDKNLLGQLWSVAGDQVNSLLGRTNIWTVQNGQTIEDIAIMVLKQIKPDYTQEDVNSMSTELINLNESALDGTKKSFLVNSKIKLPVAIDISKEKQSADPAFDYYFETQTRKMEQVVAKYNLKDDKSIKSQTFKDAVAISDAFIERYGYLDSETRESVILSPRYKPTKKTEDKVDAVKSHTSSGPLEFFLERLDEGVLKNKAANCGQVADLVSKICYEKFQDKYDISLVSFSTPRANNNDHTAFLLKSKDSKEEYVIDPWVSPKNGGVFKRKDWEAMVKEVYGITDSDKAYFTESSPRYDELNKIKIFHDNKKVIEKELPGKKFSKKIEFINYVSLEIRKGNKVSPKVMELFKQICPEEYSRLTEQKGFYAKRDLVKKEVSYAASIDINTFQDELFKNILEGKKYSGDIMSLFKQYCPDKYSDCLKSLEIKKISKELKEAFPNADIQEFIDDWWKFDSAIRKGLFEGKKYSPKIMEVYIKCDGNINRDVLVNDTRSRIAKTDKSYAEFKKNFNKNMTPESLNSYLNNIKDPQAFLVTLEKNCETLIKDIDNAKYGWGHGKEKKALIMPLVNFVIKNCSFLPKKDIEEFKQACLKELDANFYTDEKKIIAAFKTILENANSYYKEKGRLDNTLWLQQK